MFPAGGVCCDIGPSIAHTDRLAIQHVIRKEITDAVLEVTFDRWIERPVRKASIEPPDRPLTGPGIVGAQTQGTISTPWRFNEVVFNVAPTAHHSTGAARTFELHPFAAPERAMMNTPLAELKVEVVQTRKIGALGGCIFDGGSCEAWGEDVAASTLTISIRDTRFMEKLFLSDSMEPSVRGRAVFANVHFSRDREYHWIVACCRSVLQYGHT